MYVCVMLLITQDIYQLINHNPLRSGHLLFVGFGDW